MSASRAAYVIMQPSRGGDQKCGKKPDVSLVQAPMRVRKYIHLIVGRQGAPFQYFLLPVIQISPKLFKPPPRPPIRSASPPRWPSPPSNAFQTLDTRLYTPKMIETPNRCQRLKTDPAKFGATRFSKWQMDNKLMDTWLTKHHHCVYKDH